MDDHQKQKKLIGYIEGLRDGKITERNTWLFHSILTPMVGLENGATTDEVLVKMIGAFLGNMNKGDHWLLDPKPALLASIGMSNWLKTGNHFHLSQVIYHYEREAQGLPNILILEFAKIGMSAAKNELKLAPQDKVRKKAKQAQFLLLMHAFVEEGLTLEKASLKVATLFAEQYPDIPRWPASGISRLYSKKMKNPKEKEFFDAAVSNVDRQSQGFVNLMEGTPMATGLLAGNRR